MVDSTLKMMRKVDVVAASPGWYALSPCFEGKILEGFVKEPIIAWATVIGIAPDGRIESTASEPIFAGQEIDAGSWSWLLAPSGEVYGFDRAFSDEAAAIKFFNSLDEGEGA